MSGPIPVDPAQRPRRNVECKALDPDPDRSLEVCRQIGAKDHGQIWQQDTYFNVANGGLKLREEHPGRPHLIQFERANEPQQRESRYRIIEVGDGPMLSAALAAELIWTSVCQVPSTGCPRRGGHPGRSRGRRAWRVRDARSG